MKDNFTGCIIDMKTSSQVKKRNKKQIINTRHERGAITADLTYINLTVRIYHEWLYTNKYEDLDQTPEWHTL